MRSAVIQKFPQTVCQTSEYYHLSNFEKNVLSHGMSDCQPLQRYELFTFQDTLPYQFMWASLKLTHTSVINTTSYPSVPLHGICKYDTCHSVKSVTAACRPTRNGTLQSLLSEFMDRSLWSTSAAH